jgi:predicted DNA binding CopG/RHH family protein
LATKAKLESNARYLAKFKTVSIRIPEEELPAVKRAADSAGVALSAYILRAIREQIRRDDEARPERDKKNGEEVR